MHILASAVTHQNALTVRRLHSPYIA